MSEKLVDFHCHLDLFPDFEAKVRECDDLGIFTLAVTTTPRAWRRNEELAAKTRHVRAALGLHPQLVASNGREIDLFEELLPLTRYVGEVGLDAGPRFFRSMPQQREVFGRILDACVGGEPKILSVHSVRATAEVLDMVERRLAGSRSRVVLHWFSGTRSEARRAVELGCWFSANAQMMGKAKSAQIFAAEVPLERVLTETDGPFSETNGKPCTPSDARESVSALAAAYGVSRAEAASQVLKNLRTLVG